MSDEKDPIIEMYLKTSRGSRIRRVLTFALVFTAIACFGAYYYYASSSLEHRETLREASPAIERVATFLDGHGMIPLAPEEVVAQQEAAAKRKEKPAVKVIYPDVVDATTPVEKMATPEQQRMQAKANAEFERYAELEKRVAAGETIDITEFGGLEGQSPVQPQGSNSGSLLDVSNVLAQFQDEGQRTIIVETLDGSKVSYSGEALDGLRQNALKRFAEKEKLAQAYLSEGNMPIYWKVWDGKDPISGDDFMGVSAVKQSFNQIDSSSYSINIAFTNSQIDYTIFPYFNSSASVMSLPELFPSFIEQAQMHFDLAEVYARTMRELAAKNSHILKPQRQGFSQVSNEGERTFQRQVVEFHNQIDRIRELFRATADQMIADINGPDGIAKTRAWREEIAASLAKLDAYKLDVEWSKMRNSGQRDAIFYAAQLKEWGDGGQSASLKKARRWYQFATNVKSGEGANNLARMHLLGLGGLGRDPKAAFNMLQRAVEVQETQSSIAMLNLGVMYQHGIGCVQDKEKARDLFARSGKHFRLAAQALANMDKEPAAVVDTSQMADTWRATND